MMKSFSMNPLMMMPMIFNLLIIIMMMSPSKMNKFHPISFMIMLIFLTFLITINMNFIFNSWISFILFLTMIGGLMVIFMYITSLSNNELFYLNFKLILINFMKIFMLLMLILFIQNLYNEYLYLKVSTSWLNNYIFIYDQNNMNFLYKKLYNKSTIFIMLYLYYSMICIMNICINFKSPLRQLMF